MSLLFFCFKIPRTFVSKIPRNFCFKNSEDLLFQKFRGTFGSKLGVDYFFRASFESMRRLMVLTDSKVKRLSVGVLKQ